MIWFIFYNIYTVYIYIKYNIFQNCVDDVYTFRDGFIQERGLAAACLKDQEVEARAKEAMVLLEEMAQQAGWWVTESALQAGW